jgi:hypothetical protein
MCNSHIPLAISQIFCSFVANNNRSKRKDKGHTVTGTLLQKSWDDEQVYFPRKTSIRQKKTGGHRL